jgi:hypothetical protein
MVNVFGAYDVAWPRDFVRLNLVVGSKCFGGVTRPGLPPEFCEAGDTGDNAYSYQAPIEAGTGLGRGNLSHRYEKRQLNQPMHALSDCDLEGFSEAVKARLVDSNLAFRKAYLQLFFGRVDVDDEIRFQSGAHVSGS